MPRNPKEKYKKPPLPKQTQNPPGTDQAMNPKPDFGEGTYHGSARLHNKVALITGGDSGIGKAVALAFAREGADIAISYFSDEESEDARETERFVRDAGKRVLSIKGDVRDEEFCEELVDTTFQTFGKIDVLVNNAAYQKVHESIVDISSKDLERIFRTNIFSVFFMTKAAFSKMKEGSSIINTISIQAFHPSGHLLAYASTKGALAVFTKAFSQESIKKGIRVNGIAPGPVWTPLIPSSMETEQFGASNPTGRPGQPIEMAPLYVLLASDEASYINGEIWGATGGAMSE